MPAVSRSSIPAFLFLLASVCLAQTPAPDGPPYRVGGDVLRPQKIAGAPPEYTLEARWARVTGAVIVDALIDEQGNVTDVKLLQGLFTGLDESAMTAIKAWKFKPAELNGRPVPVYYTLTVNFTVDNAPRPWPFSDAFLDENPEFENLFNGRRYPEALALLEARSGPEIHIARAAVLAKLGRFDEALEEAKAYGGEDPDVILDYVALAVLDAVSDLSLEEKRARAGDLDVGLEAATLALAAQGDDGRLMVTKSRLLREKAKLATGPERTALVDEAVGLEKRAIAPQ